VDGPSTVTIEEVDEVAVTGAEVTKAGVSKAEGEPAVVGAEAGLNPVSHHVITSREMDTADSATIVSTLTTCHLEVEDRIEAEVMEVAAAEVTAEGEGEEMRGKEAAAAASAVDQQCLKSRQARPSPCK